MNNRLVVYIISKNKKEEGNSKEDKPHLVHGFCAFLKMPLKNLGLWEISEIPG